MGNGADAKRRSREAGAGIARRRHSRAVNAGFETLIDPLLFEIVKVTPDRSKRGSRVRRRTLSHQGISRALTRVRKFLCLVLFSLLAQASLFFYAAHAEPIRLAYSSICGARASLWVAQDYGYFRRQGLDEQLIYIGGRAAVAA